MKPQKNAPMSSAPFVYDKNGKVAWNKMWSSFCYLAIEGGPAHRDTKLFGKGLKNDLNSSVFRESSEEILRAYKLLVPYRAVDNGDGYIKMTFLFPNIAKWYKYIIESENVEAKIEGRNIFLPVNDDFKLEKEVKNLVTVVAKAYHYWYFHVNLFEKLLILFGKIK